MHYSEQLLSLVRALMAVEMHPDVYYSEQPLTPDPVNGLYHSRRALGAMKGDDINLNANTMASLLMQTLRHYYGNDLQDLVAYHLQPYEDDQRADISMTVISYTNV